MSLGLQQLSGAARQDSTDDGALTPRRSDKAAVARGMSMRRTSNNATRRLSTAIAGLVPTVESPVSSTTVEGAIARPGSAAQRSWSPKRKKTGYPPPHALTRCAPCLLVSPAQPRPSATETRPPPDASEAKPRKWSVSAMLSNNMTALGSKSADPATGRRSSSTVAAAGPEPAQPPKQPAPAQPSPQAPPKVQHVTDDVQPFVAERRSSSATPRDTEGPSAPAPAKDLSKAASFKAAGSKASASPRGDAPDSQAKQAAPSTKEAKAGSQKGLQVGAA